MGTHCGLLTEMADVSESYTYKRDISEKDQIAHLQASKKRLVRKENN